MGLLFLFAGRVAWSALPWFRGGRLRFFWVVFGAGCIASVGLEFGVVGNGPRLCGLRCAWRGLPWLWACVSPACRVFAPSFASCLVAAPGPFLLRGRWPAPGWGFRGAAVGLFCSVSWLCVCVRVGVGMLLFCFLPRVMFTAGVHCRFPVYHCNTPRCDCCRAGTCD